MTKTIAKFSIVTQMVKHFGEVKTLPARTVFSANENAMVYQDTNPMTGAKEQYTFAVAYFVYGGKRQEETVALPVATLVSLPDADSSKKESKPKTTLGAFLK